MLLALTSKLGSRFRASARLSYRCSTAEEARNNTPLQTSPGIIATGGQTLLQWNSLQKNSDLGIPQHSSLTQMGHNSLINLKWKLCEQSYLGIKPDSLCYQIRILVKFRQCQCLKLSIKQQREFKTLLQHLVCQLGSTIQASAHDSSQTPEMWRRTCKLVCHLPF